MFMNIRYWEHHSGGHWIIDFELFEELQVSVVVYLRLFLFFSFFGVLFLLRREGGGVGAFLRFCREIFGVFICDNDLPSIFLVFHSELVEFWGDCVCRWNIFYSLTITNSNDIWIGILGQFLLLAIHDYDSAVMISGPSCHGFKHRVFFLFLVLVEIFLFRIWFIVFRVVRRLLASFVIILIYQRANRFRCLHVWSILLLGHDLFKETPLLFITLPLQSKIFFAIEDPGPKPLDIGLNLFLICSLYLLDLIFDLIAFRNFILLVLIVKVYIINFDFRLNFLNWRSLTIAFWAEHANCILATHHWLTCLRLFVFLFIWVWIAIE